MKVVTGKRNLLILDFGDAQQVRGISPDEPPIQWDTSGTQRYVWNGSFPTRVRLINPGKTWLETMPPDPAGLLYANLYVTPDGKSYAYR